MKTFKWNDKNESFGIFHLNVLRGTEKRIFNIHEISWTKFLRLAYIVDFDLKSILIFFYNYVYSPQQSSAPFCRSIPFKRRTWKKFYVFFFRMFRMILISFAAKLNRRNQAMLRTFHSRNGRIVQFQSASAKLKVALANWPKASPKHWITALPLIRRLIPPLP